jgi:hypothetical protein
MIIYDLLILENILLLVSNDDEFNLLITLYKLKLIDNIDNLSI